MDSDLLSVTRGFLRKVIKLLEDAMKMMVEKERCILTLEQQLKGYQKLIAEKEKETLERRMVTLEQQLEGCHKFMAEHSQEYLEELEQQQLEVSQKLIADKEQLEVYEKVIAEKEKVILELAEYSREYELEAAATESVNV